MFNLLKIGERISQEAWKLLIRLPTSPELMKKLKNFEGVILEENKLNWENLLDTSSNYNLFYTLTIIEYLMEHEEETNSNDWRKKFIELEGFSHFVNLFTKFSEIEFKNLSYLEKRIINFLLKILKTYLIATFKKKNVYQITEFSKIFNFSVDMISNALQEEKKNLIQEESLVRKLSYNERKKSNEETMDEEQQLMSKKQKENEKKNEKKEEVLVNIRIKLDEPLKLMVNKFKII